MSDARKKLGSEPTAGNNTEPAQETIHSGIENDFNSKAFHKEVDSYWLEEVVPKHNIEPSPEVSQYMRPGYTLYLHQRKAVANIHRAHTTRFKGLILADSPGMGTTLSFVAAVAEGWKPNDGPCLIVVQASQIPQLMSEINKFFDKGQFPVILYNEVSEKINEIVLVQYKLIVTSYDYVLSEYESRENFKAGLAAWERDRSLEKPVRPHMVLISDNADMTLSGFMGKYICFDDICAPVSDACSELRGLYETCIMSTDSPLVNGCLSGVGLLTMLEGHGMFSCDRMFQALESLNRKPEGRYFDRAVRTLQAVVLRRPANTVQRPPVTVKIIPFSLSKKEAADSNALYDLGKTSKTILDERFIKAQQIAKHPSLPYIHWHMDNLKEDTEQQEALKSWIEDLRGEDALNHRKRWQSEKVYATLDCYAQARTLDDDVTMVVMDKDVYFLDIVALGFEDHFPDVQIFKYNFREDSVGRNTVLNNFNAYPGHKVLLTTHVCGRGGLNLQAANVLVQCTPWDNAAWEEEARGCLDRIGQTRRVTIYKLLADNCKIEAYTVKRRDKRNVTVSKVMDLLTRDDRTYLEPTDVPWTNETD